MYEGQPNWENTMTISTIAYWFKLHTSVHISSELSIWNYVHAIIYTDICAIRLPWWTACCLTCANQIEQVGSQKHISSFLIHKEPQQKYKYCVLKFKALWYKIFKVVWNVNILMGWRTGERGNYRIWVYLSSVRHKNLKIVCIPEAIILSWLHTKINYKDLNLVHSRSFEISTW